MLILIIAVCSFAVAGIVILASNAKDLRSRRY